MQKLIELITSKYHPHHLTFTRVSARQIVQELNLTPEDLDALDAQWDDIEAALKEQNLLVLPALPDASEAEDIRIFRQDAPLTQVLVEALYPTPQGDSILVRTISAIQRNRQAVQARPHEHKGPRPNQSGAPTGHRFTEKAGSGRNGHNNKHSSPPQRPARREPKFYCQTPDPMEACSRAHFTRPLQ